MDFRFLKDITSISSTPGYKGYNTKLRLKQGYKIKSNTNALYSPLIDKQPSDLSSILTAIYAIEKFAKEAEQ